jgi:ribonuclease G
MTMSVELQRSLHRVLRKHPDVHELKITVNPHVLQRLRSEDEELLIEIERKYEGRMTFRSDATFHHERFTIVDAQSGQELKD